MIRLTINASVRHPEALSTYTIDSLQALHQELLKASGPGEKEESDLLVPVASWYNLHRSIANIEMMSSIFVGDLDGLEPEQVEVLIDALKGVSCIIYTTHSHMTPRKQGKACYRVIVELDAEYPPTEHLRLWDAINRRLQSLLDPGARTPEQGYYLPSYPEGWGHHADVVWQEGEPWSVEELLAEAETPSGVNVSPEGVQPPPKAHPPSQMALTAQLNSWVRNQTDPQRKEVGKAARDLLSGKNSLPLGRGLRNGFLITLCGYLAKVWPNCDPEGITHHFQTIGWDLFNADGKYPLTAFTAMLGRMQEQEQASNAELAAQHRAEQAAALMRITGGERCTPIEDDEVRRLEEDFGPRWEQHLIGIHKRDLFFLRPDGTYDPGAVMRESLFIAARDRLAVFGDWVEYSYEDAQGNEKRKGEKAFLEEYGRVVRAVVFDMTLPRGGWDARTETILLPAAEPVVYPRGHEDIQDWLEAHDPHLIDMLSVMPRLGTMLPALVLTGPKNAGKTILAKGLGQIYGTDPLDSEVAFSNFNATQMTRQPIIFMDEKAAKAYRSEGTTLIRRFLTCGSRWLDEKYQARVELRGYPRLIIAANSLDVLNTQEEMTAEDRHAFAERLVHIDMAAGMDVLRRHRKEIQPRWLTGKALAEHILYLSENWEIRNPGDRFAVSSNHTSLHDGLASRSGKSGDISYWLLAYVAQPKRADNAHLPISFEDGRLKVNASALVDGWGHYLKDHKPPSPSQISRALKALSTGSRKKIKMRGGRVDAYEIDPRLLRNANETHQLVSDFDRVFRLTEPDR
jgi:hypothetical protein